MRLFVHFLLVMLLASITVGPMVQGQVDIQALLAKQDALKQTLKATQEKMTAFDKTKATAKEETVSIPGIAKEIVYTDENGNILTDYVDASGNIVKSDYYDPKTKNRLVVEYNSAGNVASTKLVDEAHMQELTITNTAAGGSTVAFHDIITGDTLTTGYDKPNGEGKIVVPTVYSKTPGLPPGTHWCPNTGQWETTKPTQK